MRRRAVAAVLAAVAGISLVGCSSGSGGSSGSASDDSSGTPIRMGVEPWIGYGPWHVADQKGFFGDQGVDVTITNFDADADINAALASGNLDVANVAAHTALNFIESGVDVKIILLLDASMTADAIISGPDITSIADLEGKQVAYEEGTTSDLLINYALKANGMSISDIQKVPMGAADAGTALIGGKVPVAVTYEPYITDAQQADPDIKLLFTAGEKKGLISDVLVVRNDVLTSRKADLQKVVSAWGDALDYYASNTDDAQTIIATAVGSDPGALKTAFDGVQFFTLDDNKTELGGDFLSSTLPAVEEAATDAGIIKGGTDLESAVDTEFVSGS